MPVFTTNISKTLKVGDRIEIGGKIKINAKKMSVNLCAQQGDEPTDVVIHFDVRFNRDSIISLSRKNGVWIGSGCYDTNYNMFIPGSKFEITFEIKDIDAITVYCQGKFHSHFLPKIPLRMAKYLVAWGDIYRITNCYFLFKGDNDNEYRRHIKSIPTPAITDDAKSERIPMHEKVLSDIESSKNILYNALMYPNWREESNETRKETGKLPKDSRHFRGFSNATELSDCSEEVVSKTVDYTKDDIKVFKKHSKNKFPLPFLLFLLKRRRKH